MRLKADLMREERGTLSGDVLVFEPFNLWGSIGGNVKVIEGGKFYVRGAIYGDLEVEHGGRVHIYGNVTGSITVLRGAKLIHSGVCAADMINDGGRIFIDSNAQVHGKIRTKQGQTTDRRIPEE